MENKLSYPDGYQDALESAAFYPIPGAGALWVKGPDRQAFLQRQTTNDLRALAPGKAVLTVLTSATARILDVLFVFQEKNDAGEDGLLALTLPGRASATLNFLKRRFFFNDNVSVTDVSAHIFQAECLGPGGPQALAHLGVKKSPMQGEVVEENIDGVRVHLLGLPSSFGMGVRLLAPHSQAARLSKAFLAVGVAGLSDQAYQVLRVENGLPGAGGELVEEYTPLEMNLQAAISDSKGCYTGQEVIARQVTYDKVTGHLMGLRLEEMVEPGAKVWAQGKPAGKVTSVAQSPRLGPIALAVIKRPNDAPGTPLKVGPDAERGVSAVVHSAPFFAR